MSIFRFSGEVSALHSAIRSPVYDRYSANSVARKFRCAVTTKFSSNVVLVVEPSLIIRSIVLREVSWAWEGLFDASYPCVGSLDWILELATSSRCFVPCQLRTDILFEVYMFGSGRPPRQPAHSHSEWGRMRCSGAKRIHFQTPAGILKVNPRDRSKASRGFQKPFPGTVRNIIRPVRWF